MNNERKMVANKDTTNCIILFFSIFHEIKKKKKNVELF